MATIPPRGARATCLILLSSAIVCHAQYTLDGLNLSNSIGCDYFDEQELILDHVPPPGNNVLAIGPNTGLYTLRSDQRVTVRDNFKMSCLSGSNSSNRGIIGAVNQLLDVSLLAGTYSSMPEYELMEFGINLDGAVMPPIPASLQRRIDTFLEDQAIGGGHHYKPGTQQYDQAFKDGTIINPYDPAHISVDALFYRPSSPHTAPTIKHGFYMGKEMYDLVDPDPAAPGNTWHKLREINGYPWRVRFAPDEVGHWAGFINIWLGPQSDGMGSRKLWETYGFRFTVVNPTGEEGYVVVSQQARDHLVFHGTDGLFVPCGQNYGWPKEHYGSCTDVHCVNYDDHRMRPSARAELNNFVQEFARDGHGEQLGNTTRLFFTPWGFMVEREQLANYRSRAVEMDELDRYFHQLERNGLKVLLSMGESEINIDGCLDGNCSYNENWAWNPYRDPPQTSTDPNKLFKGVAGVTTPLQFLTDPTCIRFFKNRLRYIDARWGYSKALLGYDWNEVDLGGGFFNGGQMDPASAEFIALKNWLRVMTTYIKQELHSPHLTSIGTSGVRMVYDPGTPEGRDGIARLALYQDLPDVDIVSDHVYGNGEGTVRLGGQHVRWLRDADPAITKPMFIEESGTWRYEEVENCTDLRMHNTSWASALSGTAGAAMIWPWRRYNLKIITSDWVSGGSSDPPNYPLTPPFHGEYAPNYPRLRRFIEEMDPAHNQYTYHNIGAFGYQYGQANEHEGFMFGTGQNQLKQYEVFSAVREDREVAFGWVHNRSSIECNYAGVCANVVAPGSNEEPIDDMTEMHALIPQSAVDLPQDYDTDGYLSATGWPSGVFEMQAGGDDLVGVYGLLPSTLYNLRWVDTWGPDCGDTEIYPDEPVTSGADGRAYIDPPPTVFWKTEPRPGDWAFRMTVAGRSKSVAALPALGFKAYLDRNLLSVRFSAEFSGGIFLYDATGRVVASQTQLDGARSCETPVSLADGVYLLKTEDRAGAIRWLKLSTVK